MFGGTLKSSKIDGAAGGSSNYSHISVNDRNFPSATETKQDYFKFNTKDVSSTRSKLLFSPAVTNEGGMTEDEYGGL